MRISSPPTTHSCYYGIDTPERGKLMAARNWLSLEPDAAWATSRKRLWANWHVEREAEPYTKVIHPR